MRINQDLPIIVTGGKAYHLLVGERDSFDHDFGGAGLHSDAKTREHPLRLQPLFSFDCIDPRFGSLSHLGRLPLYYGFEYSSCTIEYSIEAGTQFKLKAINPEQPEPGWPYPDYPLDFPLNPVRMEPIELPDLKEVIPQYAYFASLGHHGSEPFDPRRYAYIVVTPRKEYGVSLWGEDGDAAMVTVGFSVNLHSGIMKGEQAFG